MTSFGDDDTLDRCIQRLNTHIDADIDRVAAFTPRQNSAMITIAAIEGLVAGLRVQLDTLPFCSDGNHPEKVADHLRACPNCRNVVSDVYELIAGRLKLDLLIEELGR